MMVQLVELLGQPVYFYSLLFLFIFNCVWKVIIVDLGHTIILCKLLVEGLVRKESEGCTV